MSLTLGRFVEFPRAAPSGIPQTSLGFWGHLITNFPHIMVLLIIVVLIRSPWTLWKPPANIILGENYDQQVQLLAKHASTKES
jgi:hypothetical protein